MEPDKGGVMAVANLSTAVRKTGQDTCVVDIMGEINAQAEGALMEAYNQACSNGARSIILNFNGLEYMNSSGIGVLVTLLIRVRRQNQRLMAYGLNEHYRQIFELTRLNEAITIHNDEFEALAAVA
jgi:anti-sigma B factor antagonist